MVRYLMDSPKPVSSQLNVVSVKKRKEKRNKTRYSKTGRGDLIIQEGSCFINADSQLQSLLFSSHFASLMTFSKNTRALSFRKKWTILYQDIVTVNQLVSALCLGWVQNKPAQDKQQLEWNGIEPYIPCRSALVKPTL